MKNMFSAGALAMGVVAVPMAFLARLMIKLRVSNPHHTFTGWLSNLLTHTVLGFVGGLMAVAVIVFGVGGIVVALLALAKPPKLTSIIFSLIGGALAVFSVYLAFMALLPLLKVLTQ